MPCGATGDPRRFERLDRLSSQCRYPGNRRARAALRARATGYRRILTEVLQGCTSERRFDQTLELLSDLDLIEIGGREVAIEAARNFRRLRAKGITVRKTIDTLIATRCILDELKLLYSDRDFDPFVEHLGLTSALDS